MTAAFATVVTRRLATCVVCPSSWLYEPLNHSRKTRLIFCPNGLELHTYSISSLNVSHRGAGSDFSILDKKM